MQTYIGFIFQDAEEPVYWYGVVPAVKGAYTQGKNQIHTRALLEEILADALEFQLERFDHLPNDITNTILAKRQTLEEFGITKSGEFLEVQCPIPESMQHIFIEKGTSEPPLEAQNQAIVVLPDYEEDLELGTAFVCKLSVEAGRDLFAQDEEN